MQGLILALCSHRLNQEALRRIKTQEKRLGMFSCFGGCNNVLWAVVKEKVKALHCRGLAKALFFWVKLQKRDFRERKLEKTSGSSWRTWRKWFIHNSHIADLLYSCEFSCVSVTVTTCTSITSATSYIATRSHEGTLPALLHTAESFLTNFQALAAILRLYFLPWHLIGPLPIFAIWSFLRRGNIKLLSPTQQNHHGIVKINQGNTGGR